MLLTVAVVLFAIAAALGATMAVLHFMGKSPPPMMLAVLHAVFIVPGFGVLLGAAWPAFSGPTTWALILFGLAALGGLAMVLGWRAKPLPSALVLVHGGAALTAFAILLMAFFGV